MYTVLSMIIIIAVLVSIAPSGSSPMVSKKTEKVSEAAAWHVCQHYVKQKLLSPATASFPLFYDRFSKVDETTFWLEGHVDSQNAYGAEVRTSFQIKVQYTGGEKHLPQSWRELEFREL